MWWWKESLAERKSLLSCSHLQACTSRPRRISVVPQTHTEPTHTPVPSVPISRGRTVIFDIVEYTECQCRKPEYGGYGGGCLSFFICMSSWRPRRSGRVESHSESYFRTPTVTVNFLGQMWLSSDILGFTWRYGSMNDLSRFYSGSIKTLEQDLGEMCLSSDIFFWGS